MRRTDSDYAKDIAPVAAITALQSLENCDRMESPNLISEQTQESGQATSQNLSAANGVEDTSKYFDHEATSPYTWQWRYDAPLRAQVTQRK